MSYLVDQYHAAPGGGGAFASMTEALDPAPTIVPKTHFVEWFSGDALDSIWTLDGTGSGAMNDAVNGGYRLTTTSTTNEDERIYFNNIRHYAHDGSVFISVASMNSATDSLMHTGLIEQLTDTTDTRIQLYQFNPNETNVILVTSVNTVDNKVDTGVVISTDTIKYKMELKSASALAWMDDDLTAISTASLPDVAMQPFHSITTRTTAVKTSDIRYMECFNT